MLYQTGVCWQLLMTEKGETAAGQWLSAVCFKVCSRAGWLGRGEAAVLCFQAPCSHPLLCKQVIPGCRDHLHLSLPLHRSFQTSGVVHLVFSIVKFKARFLPLDALFCSQSPSPGRSVSQVRELRSTFPPHSTMQTFSTSRGTAWNCSESTAATPTPAVGSISSFILSHTNRVARCWDRTAAVIPAATTCSSRATGGTACASGSAALWGGRAEFPPAPSSWKECWCLHSCCGVQGLP